MIRQVRIYYEGHPSLKPGLSKFFAELSSRAKERGCRFELISGGSGEAAARDFGRAVAQHRDSLNILLRDSEGPDTGSLSEALCSKYSWPASFKASLFWMVEMMEAWFHADKEALESFYGPGFRKSALKANPKVEEISKMDLESGLSAATAKSSKGDYFDYKTTHGPKLLAEISPEKVRKAAPNCERLFATVLAQLDRI